MAASRVWPGARSDFVLFAHISSHDRGCLLSIASTVLSHLGAVLSFISNTFDKFLNMVSALVWSVVRLGPFQGRSSRK
jgi:hypothetical protein